jgi:hypothetical protein
LGESEDWLGGDEDVTEQRLNEVFERFERHQPVLADRIGAQLGRSRDEVALALGYYLSLVIWLSFERVFGPNLRRITHTDVTSVEEALALDEELRGSDPAEAVDSDDVIAMEQPHVLAFVHDHIDAALDVHAHQVDVDAVHSVYRVILIEVLALSYAVVPPEDFVATTSEIHA